MFVPPPRRPLALLGAVLLASAALPGCGGAAWEPSAEGTDGPAVVVDPSRGRAGEAGLGSSAARLGAAFGPARSTPDAADRGWLRLGLPGTYGYPRSCSRAGRAVRYQERSFAGAAADLCAGRAFLIAVTGRGSRTTAGARIGQSLDRAVARHPGLRCDTSIGNTTDPGVPVFRYCTGRVAPGRFLWLGQDPVSSIAIASVPLA